MIVVKPSGRELDLLFPRPIRFLFFWLLEDLLL